jgi:hypothetical protein
VDLAPAVLAVVDPRPDDGDARADVRDRHDRAVLGNDLDDERVLPVCEQPRVVGAQIEMNVAVVHLVLDARHHAGGDDAAVADVEPVRVVDPGERRTAAAVRRRR